MTQLDVHSSLTNIEQQQQYEGSKADDFFPFDDDLETDIISELVGYPMMQPDYQEQQQQQQQQQFGSQYWSQSAMGKQHEMENFGTEVSFNNAQNDNSFNAFSAEMPPFSSQDGNQRRELPSLASFDDLDKATKNSDMLFPGFEAPAPSRASGNMQGHYMESNGLEVPPLLRSTSDLVDFAPLAQDTNMSIGNTEPGLEALQGSVQGSVVEPFVQPFMDKVVVDHVGADKVGEFIKVEVPSTEKVALSRKRKAADIVERSEPIVLKPKSKRRHRKKATTSMTVFEKYIRKVVTADGKSRIDASGIVSRECYEAWVNSRKRHLSCPEEAFRKALVARVTISDNASLPFPPEVERAVLNVLRRREIWPCFKGRNFPGTGKPILIGTNGLRARGYHEVQAKKNKAVKAASGAARK